MSEISSNTSSLSKNKLIIIAVAVLLVGGIAGYFIGVNTTEDKQQEELSSLQQELEQARTGASDEIQEGQEAITEGQQTLESLQAENASLKATIEQQNQKIADLEQQLEEAGSATPPTQ